MSDPLTGTGVVVGSGLVGSVLYGIITHTDFGIVFGSFGGAVFYVATATNISRLRLMACFMTSFIVGILGASLTGDVIAKLTGLDSISLDAIAAVIVSALAIKILTFINSQDVGSLFGFFSRFRGGGNNNDNR